MTRHVIEVPLQISQNSGTAVNILFSFCEMSLLTKKTKTMATKISHKVLGLPSPPYLGLSPKFDQFFECIPILTLTNRRKDRAESGDPPTQKYALRPNITSL